MREVLFHCGGGIGNIIQATPTFYLVANSGYIVDLLLECNSTSKIRNLFDLEFVREVYVGKMPNRKYDIQLSGPFTSGKKFSDKALRTRVYYAQHVPETEVYYDLAKQIGIEQPLPEETFINVGDNGPCPKSNSVAIYPGSKHNWAMKRWDKHDLLSREFDNVVVVGTKQDVHSHGNPAWITKQWDWGENVEFFHGTLRETAFLISQCKMFVGNDGGLSHVAAATGIPTFIIFGPSSDIKNKPHVKNAHVIALDLPCRPCQFQVGPDGKQIFGSNKADCPYHMKCLRELTVSHVVEKLPRNGYR